MAARDIKTSKNNRKENTTYIFDNNTTIKK